MKKEVMEEEVEVKKEKEYYRKLKPTCKHCHNDTGATSFRYFNNSKTCVSLQPRYKCGACKRYFSLRLKKPHKKNPARPCGRRPKCQGSPDPDTAEPPAAGRKRRIKRAKADCQSPDSGPPLAATPPPLSINPHASSSPSSLGSNTLPPLQWSDFVGFNPNLDPLLNDLAIDPSFGPTTAGAVAHHHNPTSISPIPLQDYPHSNSNPTLSTIPNPTFNPTNVDNHASIPNCFNMTALHDNPTFNPTNVDDRSISSFSKIALHDSPSFNTTNADDNSIPSFNMIALDDHNPFGDFDLIDLVDQNPILDLHFVNLDDYNPNPISNPLNVDGHNPNLNFSHPSNIIDQDHNPNFSVPRNVDQDHNPDYNPNPDFTTPRNIHQNLDPFNCNLNPNCSLTNLDGYNPDPNSSMINSDSHNSSTNFSAPSNLDPKSYPDFSSSSDIYIPKNLVQELNPILNPIPDLPLISNPNSVMYWFSMDLICSGRAAEHGSSTANTAADNDLFGAVNVAANPAVNPRLISTRNGEYFVLGSEECAGWNGNQHQDQNQNHCMSSLYDPGYHYRDIDIHLPWPDIGHIDLSKGTEESKLPWIDSAGGHGQEDHPGHDATTLLHLPGSIETSDSSATPPSITDHREADHG